MTKHNSPWSNLFGEYDTMLAALRCIWCLERLGSGDPEAEGLSCIEGACLELCVPRALHPHLPT